MTKTIVCIFSGTIIVITGLICVIALWRHPVDKVYYQVTVFNFLIVTGILLLWHGLLYFGRRKNKIVNDFVKLNKRMIVIKKQIIKTEQLEDICAKNLIDEMQCITAQMMLLAIRYNINEKQEKKQIKIIKCILFHPFLTKRWLTKINKKQIL